MRPCLRVLLIEDYGPDAQLVQRIAQRVDSHEICLDHVQTLAEGLEKICALEYEAVLSDLSLPDSDWQDTIRSLVSAGANVPVIVMSGLENDDAIDQALRAGAQDYLVKGRFDADLLMRSLRYSIERYRADRQMNYLATHDQLTGLANRTLFWDRLRGAVSTASRNGDHVALLYIDLDEFKPINDKYGHHVGDHVLQIIADRISSCIRVTDSAVRLGGDEFAVILSGISHPASVEYVTDRILSACSDPITIEGGLRLRVSASIGLAIAPDDGDDPEVLVQTADGAMLIAKVKGRNTYHWASAAA